jgi:hypothetical protein
VIDYKPWELYPHLWKTEAEFWTYLRGSLRRGIWEKSPIKLDFKNKNCSPPPADYTGRGKSGQYCALSGKWTNKSALEVDHVEGHMSLLSWEDILPFVMHLVPPPDNMQLVAKEAHKIKSYAERIGVSYEEAVYIKQAINWEKENSAKEQVAFLLSKGYSKEESSVKNRRQTYIKYLKQMEESNEAGSNK